ncbi:MAG: peptidoglycan editing factor PgeF [Candidatus Omnitrophica bacterium]|nr:peptidoglycan editing factor PgeF [Candidatus Omnitrophota bacterium]
MSAFFSDTTADFTLPLGAAGLSGPQKDFLRNALSINPPKVYTMRQVHGNRVLVIGAKDIPQNSNIPEADAMVTNVPGIVLSVRTADCLPVFLYDPHSKCIGLVHAGWKGSALKIVSETVKVLSRTFESDPKDILAAFGPSIRECCYEVGEEFAKTFPGEVFQRKNTMCLNLPLVNRNQLLNSGVKDENIFESGECTVCTKGFYSFRRDQEKAGRHLSLMTMV